MYKRFYKTFICLLICAATVLALVLGAAAENAEDIFAGLEGYSFFTLTDSLTATDEEGWIGRRTELSIMPDGSFEGYYSGLCTEDSAEAYPAGTFYISNFKGEFGEFERIDEFSFSLTVTGLEYAAAEEDYVSDGVLYTFGEAYGICEGSVLVFYKLEGEIPEALAGRDFGSDKAYAAVNTETGCLFAALDPGAGMMLLPW